MKTSRVVHSLRGVRQARTDGALEHNDLLTQGRFLHGQSGAVRGHGADHREDVEQQ